MTITNRTGIVTRRNFLSGTAGAIATGAAVSMPQEAAEDLNKPIALEQMAHALHEAVGRYSDQNTPFFTVQASARQMDHSLKFAMENLRDCSVDEIQQLLKPLFEGGAI